MTRVFDVDGQEKNLEWLAREYDGCEVIPADTTDADEVWRLLAIFCTEGPTVLKIETRGKNGLAQPDQPVAFTFPSIYSPDPDLQRCPYPNTWAPRAVMDRTNGAGYWGAGLGSSYGPLYSAWVLSSAPSDLLHKTGMKGGTFHRGPLHGVWQLQDVEPQHATLHDALIWSGQKNQVIQFNPQAALQKRIFAAAFVPNSPEFEIVFNGQKYVAQRAEHMGTGEVRVYYAPDGDWQNVTYVTR